MDLISIKCASKDTPMASGSSNQTITFLGEFIVVFDANVANLATNDSVSNIFNKPQILKVPDSATDTEIANTLTQMNMKIIFITADKGTDIVRPNENIAVVRFTNNSTHTATQLKTRLGLLWRLAHTANFKVFESWFNRDICLGISNAYYIKNDVHIDIKKLYLPHQNSSEYKRWIF